MDNEEDQSNNPAVDAPSQAPMDTSQPPIDASPSATDFSQESTESPLQALSDGPSPGAVLLKTLGSKWIWWCVWLCLFLPFHFTDTALENFKTCALIGMPGILLLWSIFTAKNIWKAVLISLLLIPAGLFALLKLVSPILEKVEVEKETKVGKHLIRVVGHSYIGSSARELVEVSQLIPGIEVHKRITTSRYCFLWRRIDDNTIEWQETAWPEGWRDDLPKTLYYSP